jgi:serine protease
MKRSLTLFLLITAWNYLIAQDTSIVKGNIIVMLNADKKATSISSELAYFKGVRTDLKLQQELSSTLHIYLFTFDFSKIDASRFLAEVRSHPFVKMAQFNHTFQTRSTPNDSQFDYLWNMHNTGQSNGTPGVDIHAVQAWDLATGGLTADGDTIVVAVIDVGFDVHHIDLDFWKNYKEIPDNGLDDDQNGYVDDHDGWNSQLASDSLPLIDHGTHIAGIIGAKGNNGIGVTGVNWNVKVMAVSYGNGSGLETNAIKAYAYVLDQRKLYNQSKGTKGAFVVSTNTSFGINKGQAAAHPLWCAMYDSLGAAGILNAGATANINYNIDTIGDIPTSCSSNWLITVTNTTNKDQKDFNAGYGATTIDLGAPGTNIASTLPKDGYGYLSGTSMATPHVAGTVALMFAAACSDFIKSYKKDPAGMALLLKDSLLNAVDVIPSLNNGMTVSGGRLNLFKSVRSMKQYCGMVDPLIPVSDHLFDIIDVYPVPVSDQLTINYTSDVAADISITSVLGQEVLKTPCITSETGIIQHAKIDVIGISKGIYFITLRGKDKKTRSVKVFL